MKDRAIEIVEFLDMMGWEGAQPQPIKADFSTRRFARIARTSGLHRAILMDADADQKTHAFIVLANTLKRLDISVPEIHASDFGHGLVIMEDFGDRNFGRLVDAGEPALPYYKRALDVLVHLHKRCEDALPTNPDIAVFEDDYFITQAGLFLDAWFLLVKKRAATKEETESFRKGWETVLKPINALPKTLVIRDFMLDNLMDLKNTPANWRSVGVLDFQDGGIGPLPYDLASLCEVVRRDAPAGLLDEMIDCYYEKATTKLPKGEMRKACRILAAQRHTRILGIIANRALKTGQRDKLAYASRIWEYLDHVLQDAALLPVREWMNQHFPIAERDLVA